MTAGVRLATRLLTLVIVGTCHAATVAYAGAPADAGVASDGDADAKDGGATTDGPVLVVPPQLLGEAKADYPPKALAARVAGTVGLVITVDATGTVSDAQVLQPLGHGLDEAARAAALRARFVPATRAGQAIRARVGFSYTFVLPPPPAPAPPVPTRPAPPDNTVTDVTVKGASTAQRLRESAEAVTVVDLARAKAESSDLGEVLARVPGLSVRRSGGLGSYARIALNGLTDEQIRFYLDGIPLDTAGFGLGLQNTPVNFIERVEIYRGVVPVRFGGDALGGGINLVTLDDVRGTHGNASLELGSFGTYRLAAATRHTHPHSGMFTAASVFLDHADNDYPVSVDVADDQGRVSRARVNLFHNAYSAYGGMADIGVVDRSWARRLILRVFANRQDNDIQNNLVMSVPYGEARYWQSSFGSNLRYEQPRIAGSAFGAHAIVAYGRRATTFQDLSPWVYDWFGQRVRTRARPGEINTPADQTIWDDKVVARMGLSWTPLTWQEARLALAPTFDNRTGRDRTVAMGRDPLSALRRYLTVVAGGEYEVNLLQRRLQVITFVKGYGYATWSQEDQPGNTTVRRDHKSFNLGLGEEVRFRFTPSVWAKASYERTTRFPSPDEVFGDGVRTLANLDLMSERSHNGNLGLTVDRVRTRAGELRAEVNGFFRQAENLIVFLPSTNTSIYENVNTVRSQGVEASAGWTSPREYVTVDGNATWQSLRNRSSTGTFGAFAGDRIPNRPWLFANVSARVQKRGISVADDALSLGYYLRYVHDYYRGWESLGLRAFKQVIPAQTTHDVVLTYGVNGRVRQNWTLEIDNIADAAVYDFFGVQRPGRAFCAKMMMDF